MGSERSSKPRRPGKKKAQKHRIPYLIECIHIFGDMYHWSPNVTMYEIPVIILEWLMDNRNYLTNQDKGLSIGWQEILYTRASFRVQNRLRLLF